MKRIITLTVLNQSGVLNRITGLFTKRHYNIESITVGHTETAGISRITFVVHVADEKETEQLTKQLNKQIDVLKVTDITNQSIVQREPGVNQGGFPSVEQDGNKRRHRTVSGVCRRCRKRQRRDSSDRGIEQDRSPDRTIETIRD